LVVKEGEEAEEEVVSVVVFDARRVTVSVTTSPEAVVPSPYLIVKLASERIVPVLARLGALLPPVTG
jgi:hypothetical protein